MNSSTNGTAPSQMTGAAMADACGTITAFVLICHMMVVADGVTGLISNAGVVCLLMRGKGGLVSSDVFFFNSAFSELAICPCIILALLHHLNVANFFMPALNFCFSFVLVARPVFRCCICVDRYLAVVRPVTYLKCKALKYRLASLALAWFIAIGFCILNVSIHSSFIMALIFVLVLGVDSFCSFSILRVLKQPRPGDRSREEEMDAMKQRAFRTVLLIQAMMVVNYLPMLLYTSLANLITDSTSICHFFTAVFTCLVFGGFVDPLIYLSRAGKLPCTKRS